MAHPGRTAAHTSPAARNRLPAELSRMNCGESTTILWVFFVLSDTQDWGVTPAPGAEKAAGSNGRAKLTLFHNIRSRAAPVGSGARVL